jgi:hypothetical protein
MKRVSSALECRADYVSCQIFRQVLRAPRRLRRLDFTSFSVLGQRKEALTQHDVGGGVAGVIGGVVGGELLELADIGEHSAKTQRINDLVSRTIR